MSAPTGDPAMPPGLPGLDQRLAAAASRLRELEVAQQRLADVKQRLAVAADRAQRMGEQVRNEHRDVTKLEGVSLTRVVAALKGSREGDLERERAEEAAAAYQWREAEALRDLLAREVDGLLSQLAALPSAQAEWATVLAEKEQALTASANPRAAELLDNATQRGRLQAELKEIDEAFAAATAAASALDDVAGRLGSADNWSTYDTFFGGGALSSAMKHDRLDEAQRAASYAESKLAVLRTELADVGRDSVVMTLGVTGTTKFIDIWFDNIFTDWMVADRIHQARDSTDQARRSVSEVQASLGDKRRKAEVSLKELERRRVELLAGELAPDG